MIGFIFRFLPIILSVAGVVTGLGLNYWFNVTDWETAITFAVALVACVYVSGSSSPFARLGIMLILIIAGYVKGSVDREHELVPEFNRKVAAIHEKYKLASDKEAERQKQANDAALDQARKDKEQYDAEVQKLQEENKQLLEDAAKDKYALRPGLSLDAVDRLNKRRLRGGPGS